MVVDFLISLRIGKDELEKAGVIGYSANRGGFDPWRSCGWELEIAEEVSSGETVT
jgi:hypothetical protein